MTYKVIYPFYDLQDSGRRTYHVGDVFPHEDFEGKLTDKRITELTGKGNNVSRPVIEVVEVKEEVVEEKPKRTRRKKTTSESEG